VQELGQALGRAIRNDPETLAPAALELAAMLGGAQVLVTRSEHGVLLVQQDAPAFAVPAKARRVVDVTGAGDTLVATFALALCCGCTSEIAAQIANAASSIVVEKRGTACTTDEELRTSTLSRQLGPATSRFHADLEDLMARINTWRADGLTIGFTNGCFDLLHPGHIALLRAARQKCDRLVVGLNSDGSVRNLKGPTRPVQDEMARASVIGAIDSVSAVVLFDEPTPLSVIERLLPDVLFKGADYQIDGVVGRDVVEAHGGRVELIELVPDRSTTRTIAKIRAAEQAEAEAAAKQAAE
jgi:D-beta-D-heptose 7-phosphate kinase / D-beta-D-heptose 1-phosphate adenosyltransferase